MKEFLVILALIVLVKFWADIALFVDPRPPIDANPNAKVVLYSTEWCTYCKRARKWLEKNNVAFQELDIEKSATARQQFDALGGGGVPVVVIDGQIVRGYDTGKMEALLTRS